MGRMVVLPDPTTTPLAKYVHGIFVVCRSTLVEVLAIVCIARFGI